MPSTKKVAGALAAAVLMGCGDGTGPAPTLAVQFRVDAGGSPFAQQVTPRFSMQGSALQQQLAIDGTNGTLDLTAITLLLGELELDGTEHGDCDAEPAQCGEIEVGPLVIDLPLTGDPVTVATGAIEPGVYYEFEFEVEDFDVDEGDDAATLEDLLQMVRTRFADWPTSASMVVEGSFTGADGTSTSFRAYFRAAIEIELALDPPLEITDGSESVMVELRIADWFRQTDGTVLDLSQFDFTTTGTVVDFEVEIEDGVHVGEASDS